MKKRLLACVLSLLLMLSGALADARIEGELEVDLSLAQQLLGEKATALLNMLQGDVDLQCGEQGALGHAAGQKVYANKTQDGLLFATQALQDSGKAVRLTLPAGDVLSQVNAWLDSLGPEVAHENTVYSSLFNRSLAADVTSDMVAPVLKSMLAQLQPLLPADVAQAMHQALNAQPGTVWGRLTRYKGDEKQYPELSLLKLTLDIPGLPHVYVWLRSDEFGMSMKLGVEAAEVIDWDETMHLLEEGGSRTGFAINAFTLLFEDKKEKNTYLEAAIILPNMRLVLECDHYLSYTKDYLWEVEIKLRENQAGQIAEMELDAEEMENAQTASLQGLEEISLGDYLLSVQK